MTRKSEKMLQSLLVEVCGKEAKSVIRAACAWVNFDDDGRAATLPKLARVQIRLANAVTRYERAKKRGAQ